jgi:hypothetical protein
MTENAFKSISIYTKGTADENTNILTKNQFPLVKLPVGINMIGIYAKKCGYGTENLLYRDLDEYKIEMFRLDTLKEGLHSKIHKFLDFVPESTLFDFEGNFIKDPFRKDIILNSLEKEEISYYMIAESVNYEKPNGLVSLFICGYNKERGRVLNFDLEQKYNL